MNVVVENLTFGYKNTGKTVLQDVSFSVEKGELVSVLGPNGVGKSTLFRCILGFEQHFQGRVLLEGEDVRNLSPRTLASKIAYIPQSHYPAFQFEVGDMVLMGTTNQTTAFGSPGKKQMQTALDAMETVGISHLRSRMFHRLSGGERQLVLLARALAQKANILVLDEPVANMDFANQTRVLRMMQRLTVQGCTVIQSTHNPEHSYLYSHKILALHQGRVLGFDTPQNMITTPLLQTLYGIPLEIKSLEEDRMRIVFPLETNIE